MKFILLTSLFILNSATAYSLVTYVDYTKSNSYLVVNCNKLYVPGHSRVDYVEINNGQMTLFNYKEPDNNNSGLMSLITLDPDKCEILARCNPNSSQCF